MAIDPLLLDAVIDRIIPADEDPGALALGTPAFVRAHLAERPDLAAAVEAGLATLPEDFRRRPEDGRDDALRAIEAQGWFRDLVELTHEGFWADPGNGGNRDALSWRIVGYRPGLPEGPCGPERP